MKYIIALLLITMFALPSSAGTRDDIRSVFNEKFKLSHQGAIIFRKNKLGDKALKASQALVNASKDHPALKAIYATSDAAQKRMIKASVNGDTETEKIARKEYTAARIALAEASGNIPELLELQSKAIAATKAQSAKQTELIATTPEGRVFTEKMSALDAEIVELRKQMMLEKN